MKEREKLENSNLFEGIVSFRTVVSTMLDNTSQRKILKVFYDIEKAKKKPKEFSFIKAKSYELRFEIELVESDVINELTLGNNHGGLAFTCSDRTYLPLEEKYIENNGFYVVLDGIEDPYNFGYSLRSLYAAGVNGIIVPERNWLSVAGIVCRASAGASEMIPVYIDKNGDLVKLFKAKKYKIVCADIENSVSMYDADLKKPILLVIGGEKRGISKNILQHADETVRIEYGRTFDAHLSAASASTVLAYEIYRQNR